MNGSNIGIGLTRRLAAASLVGWMAVCACFAQNGQRQLAGMFFPSGWMGDAADTTGSPRIDFNDQWTMGCRTEPTCIKVTYRPGKVGWAGVYWQFPDGNWGDKPGRSLTGITKLTFWAKGAVGGELVEFKSGGIDANGKKYRDSFEKILGFVKLSPEWKPYDIPLAKENLQSVLGAFAWTASVRGNPRGLTFYLDDLQFE